MIFSWLSRLAALFVGTYARRRTTAHDDDDGGVAQHGGHTPNNRLTETYSLSLVYCDVQEPCDVYFLSRYWTSMLSSIDTCQNKVSADQYHVTISQAQVYNSRSRIFEVDRCPSAGYGLDRGLLSG